MLPIKNLTFAQIKATSTQTPAHENLYSFLIPHFPNALSLRVSGEILNMK